jgi:acetylglutamate kinase
LDLEKAGIDVGLADKLILLGEKDFYAHEPEQARLEMMNIISELKKYIRQKMIRKLQQAIAVAEKDGRRDDLDKLMSDLNILMSQKI